jgi:adenosine deaminase
VPDDLRSELKRWPKIDLHRHLEGSVRLGTLAEIAREHGIDLPGYAGYEEETIRPLVQITDEPRTYRHFLAKFGVLRHFYRTREVVERITYEAVADAAEDNVHYLELRFTPSALADVGHFSLEDVTQWVIASVRQAERDHDLSVGLIMSMNRHEDMEVGQQVAELAVAYRGEIVGLDLAGDEVAFSARPFAPLFQQAKKAGLGITVHAGEWRGSDNIIESIEHLCADRIGHGVRAIESRPIVDYLRRHQITLEICPTSNIQSGAVTDLSHHPLADLLDLGLCITINTDDPSVSDIQLTDEYALATGKLGLSLDGLRRAILNAASAAFLPAAERRQLVHWFRGALADLVPAD